MECGGCLLSPICLFLSSSGRTNRGLFACPLPSLYSSSGEAVSSLWALRQDRAASLPAPSPHPSEATCSHKPSAAGGLQRPSPLKSSSGSALRSAQEQPSLFLPPYLPTHTKRNHPFPPGRERQIWCPSLIATIAWLIAIFHSSVQIEALTPKNNLRLLCNRFIVCKTLSSPGSPSTFTTALGGEEGGALSPFYR